MSKSYLFMPKRLEKCRRCAYRYTTTKPLGGMRRVHEHRCHLGAGLILVKGSNHWKLGCSNFKEK